MNIKKNHSLSLRKVLLSALVAAPLATLPVPLWALPGTQAALDAVAPSKSTGTTVVLTNAGLVTVTTGSPFSWVKWTDFGSGTMTINSGEDVAFNQPSSTSAVLNLVTGGSLSSIAGNIDSNGSVFIVNPAGITVANTSNINTAGLALSTLSGENEVIFGATGTLNYSGTSSKSVISAANAINVGSTGNVVLAGAGVDVSGTITAGTLTINNVADTITPAATQVRLGASAALTLGTNGTSSTKGTGNLVINSNSNSTSVVVGVGANNVTVRGGTVTVNTAGTGGGVSQGTGVFAIGDTQSDGSLTINAGTNAVTLANLTGNGKNLGVTTTSGATSLTASSGDLKLNASTVTGNLTVANSSGSITSGGEVTVTGGTISLTDNAVDKTITFKGPGDLTFTTLSATGSSKSAITVTSTTGAVVLPAVNSNGNLTVTAQTNITQTAALSVANTTTGTASFDAVTGSITLNSANAFTKLVLKDAPGGAAVTATGTGGTLILANGTNLAGTGIIIASSGGIKLGNSSGDTVKAASTLSLTAVDGVTPGNGTITDGSDNVTVLGTLNLNASGNVILDGNTGLSTGLKSQYGQVNTLTSTGTAGSVANLTVFEATTLNLGAVTLAAGGVLKAYSATSIINTGLLTVPGATFVGAGTAAAPGDISLNFLTSGGAGNAFTGTINVIDDVALLSNTIGGASPIGNYLAKNVSLTSQNALTLNAPVNIYGAGLTGDVTMNVTGGAAISNNGSAIFTSGKLNLTTTTGAITVNNAGNSFSGVTVTSAGGAALILSKADITVNGAFTGATASSNSFQGSNVTIGSYSSDYTGSTTFTSANGKKVTDSVAGISIFGAVTFTAPGGLTINRSGHNFGGVTIDTSGNDSSATIVESGTLKLVSVSTGKGSLNATSTNADIIQTGAITLANNSGGNNATFTARNGAVVLDQANSWDKAPVNVTALNDSTIKETGKDLLLGNVTISNGKLTVDSSGKNTNQNSGTKLYVYGDTSFTTTGSNTINVGNTGNQFGGLTLTTGSGALTITESTTMNLKSISTTGNLTATSENGNIIDSGTGTLTVGGTAAFAANKGNINLALTGSSFGTVGFTTTGNASLNQTVGSTNLTTTTVGGSLTIVNTAANITQDANPIMVSGDTTFNAGAAGSSIILGSSNQFGPLKFLVGTGGASINEFSTMNLKAGTIATGPVTLTTSGSFVTSGAGNSNFLSTAGAVGTGLQIIAIGTITPGAGSLIVLNGLTVNSPSTKNLSALSLSGNLNNKTPVYLGSGADGRSPGGDPTLAPTP